MRGNRGNWKRGKLLLHIEATSPDVLEPQEKGFTLGAGCTTRKNAEYLNDL